MRCFHEDFPFLKTEDRLIEWGARPLLAFELLAMQLEFLN